MMSFSASAAANETGRSQRTPSVSLQEGGVELVTRSSRAASRLRAYSSQRSRAQSTNSTRSTRSKRAASLLSQGDAEYESEDEYERRRNMSVREWLWNTFDNPQFSPLARWISVTILLLIGISVLVILMETMPELGHVSKSVWFAIETVCIVGFTIEFTTRFITCPSKKSFVKNGMNVIDFVAIIPYYIELIAGGGSSLAVLRVLRLVRILRVLRIPSLQEYMQIFERTLQKSATALLLLVFLILLAITLFSSLVFFAETGGDDNVGETGFQNGAGFHSIPESFWWAIATVTTVGYGDISPQTTLGKFFAAVTMLSGIMIIALPITVIGSAFASEYSSYVAEREAVKAEEERAEALADENDDFLRNEILAGLHSQVQDLVDKYTERNPEYEFACAVISGKRRSPATTASGEEESRSGDVAPAAEESRPEL